MKRNITGVLVLCVGLVLSGCQQMAALSGTFQEAVTTTVPAEDVIPAANAFDILKVAATNYGLYCVNNRMKPSICGAVTRRIVIKSVKAGTGARNSLEDSVVNGTPAAASVYNVMVAAVTQLKKTPVATPQFVAPNSVETR